MTVGRYYKKDAVGGNYLPGEPKSTPHGYTLTLTDKCNGVRRVFVTNTTECKKYYPGGAFDYLADVWMENTRAWNTNDTLELYGKLADKYDDMSFNLPMFAGELGETADMLAGRLRQLAGVGRAVRRGDIARAAKLLGVTPPRGQAGLSSAQKAARKRNADKPELQRDQTVTSAWLELQYGWTPLFMDISNLADALAKRDKPRSQRLFVKKAIPKVVRTSAPKLKAEGYGIYRKSIIAYVEEVFPSLADRMGLYDPVSVAWELTPFSFVADWVLPIGDYVRARSLVSRLKGKFVLTTTDKYRVRATDSLVDPYYCLGGGSTLLTLVWDINVAVTRQVADSLPAVELPTFKIPFTGPGKRLANAVSLVREVFGDKTSRRV